MLRKAAKSSRNRSKKHGFYTPEPVRERVVMRHINGESNRLIASEEGIDRETVARILTQPEVVQKIGQGQARLLELIPKAIKAYESALDSDDPRLSAAIATKILEGTQVLGGIQQTIDIANMASPEAEREQKKLLIYGQMIDVAIQKNKRFDLSLPPEIASMEQEAALRTDELADQPAGR